MKTSKKRQRSTREYSKKNKNSKNGKGRTSSIKKRRFGAHHSNCNRKRQKTTIRQKQRKHKWVNEQSPIYGGNLQDDATIHYWSTYGDGTIPGLQASKIGENVMRKKLMRYWKYHKTTECNYQPALLNIPDKNKPMSFKTPNVLFITASINDEPHAYAECEFQGLHVLEISSLCGSNTYGRVADEIMVVLQKYAVAHNKTIQLSSANSTSNAFYETMGMTMEPRQNPEQFAVYMDTYQFRPFDAPAQTRPRTYRKVDLT